MVGSSITEVKTGTFDPLMVHSAWFSGLLRNFENSQAASWTSGGEVFGMLLQAHQPFPEFLGDGKAFFEMLLAIQGGPAG